MSLARLSDDDLHTIIAKCSGGARAEAQNELLSRMIVMLDRMIPSPRGWWRGKLVALDNKGPLATGYWGFVHGGGSPPVDTWGEIQPIPAEGPVRKLAELRKELMDQKRINNARRLAHRRTTC